MYPLPLLIGFHVSNRAWLITELAVSGTAAARANTTRARRQWLANSHIPNPTAGSSTTLSYRTLEARASRNPAAAACVIRPLSNKWAASNDSAGTESDAQRMRPQTFRVSMT